jgi:hypothetical protein
MAHSQSTASDIANTALISDHAPEANGPLLLEVKIQSDAPHGVEIPRSWGLTITNLFDKPVAIDRWVAVERRTVNGWKQNSGTQAVASCRDFVYQYDSKSSIRLAAHSSLAVHPWNGFVCGGQCPQSCMQNVYSGPGILRYVVTLLPEGKKVSSLPFAVSRPQDATP